MPAPTYANLVQYLIVSSYGGPQDAEQKDIKQAILRAYDELTTMRDWAYYHAHGRVILQAPYSTGAVASSGTTVTLTGGTWPTWAASGAYLKVGEEICRVSSRTSGSVIVLDSTLTLKADVSGEPYTLYRSVYPLPADFRNMDEPSDEYNWWSGLYVTPDEAMKIERVSNSSGEPYHWTVVKDPASGGWAIKLIGYPTKQETIDFTFRRMAADISSLAPDSATVLDIPMHMSTAMHSAAEYWLARIRKTGEDKAYQFYQRDLRLALEQDQLAPLSGRSREIWHDGGWRSPLRPDVG
jgi:hypothetical protein